MCLLSTYPRTASITVAILRGFAVSLDEGRQSLEDTFYEQSGRHTELLDRIPEEVSAVQND